MSASHPRDGHRPGAAVGVFQLEFSGSERKGIPRLSHKKSKTGCQRCRARRVKVCRYPVESDSAVMPLSRYFSPWTYLLTPSQCNEVHPVCGGCSRHGVECIYSDRASKPSSDRAASNRHKDDPDLSAAKSDLEYPESEERRLLELRLMYQWLTKSAFSFPGGDEKGHRNCMVLNLPSTAMKFPAWLNTIFAFSAIHISKTSSSPTEQREFKDHFHNYLGLALHEHRRDLEGLSENNADAICITSSLIRNCTQAVVQDRELFPYEPPSQWLYMMNGSGDVFKTAWPWVINDEASLARKIGTDGPNLSNLEEIFHPRKRESLQHLLQRNPADEEAEPWDSEIQRAYELPLCFIGGIQLAIDSGEEVAHLFRRVIAFSMFVPKRYVDLVNEKQPRALVILAYYLSYLARLRNVWWVGDTGRREIKALHSVLTNPWLGMLEWPLEKMEEVWDIPAWQYH
jgi:hypothetical protein